jgi:hypothetical protein
MDVVKRRKARVELEHKLSSAVGGVDSSGVGRILSDIGIPLVRVAPSPLSQQQDNHRNHRTAQIASPPH